MGVSKGTEVGSGLRVSTGTRLASSVCEHETPKVDKVRRIATTNSLRGNSKGLIRTDG